MPNTLIIHLQRLVFDLDRHRDVKLNDRVEFPSVLDLKEFTADEVRRRDDLAAKLEKKKGKRDTLAPRGTQSAPLEEGKQEDEEGQDNSDKKIIPGADSKADTLEEQEPTLSDDEQDG